MTKCRSLIYVFIVLLVPALVGAADFRLAEGDLGSIDPGKAVVDYDGIMNRIATEHFALDGELSTIGATKSLGRTHVRFAQTLNGLPVFGAQMVMHIDDATGKIYAVNGELGNGGDVLTPKVGVQDAFAMALGKAGISTKAYYQPELGYVVVGSDAVLAWHAVVEYTDALGNLQADRIFAGALDGELVARHPLYHYARSLNTRDCNGSTSNCPTVSTSSNYINTGDNAIDSAHNFAIDTYDFYFNNYGRDSIDGNGMTLISRVHYSNNYNNAFWDGSQMTYGDGDGTTFIPLSQDADVVAHELTHGVTERTSGLIYSNESGALNEAWSDIFGSEVDRATGATGNDIWLIGEDIYTPGTPGDALRDMADPASEGDYDCYPTRYTGSQDNGGVHWNSGIANLAYKLLVTGGSHPRSCSSSNVTAIGNTKAAAIFYDSNVNCLTPSSNFEAARYCTAGSAAALYGSAEEAAVHEAWDAVQVPNSGPPPPAPSCSDPCTGTLYTGTITTGSSNHVTPQFSSGGGLFTGILCCQAGAADLDLYLKKRVCGWGCSWSNAAVGGTAGCDELVHNYSGTSGTYRWEVDHYSGPNESYDLCVYNP